MSSILTSGCGITFSGERPTWTKVLKICGLNITDVSGPAISNQLIVNQLLTEVYKNKFDHVVCQLTSVGKLDVEINNTTPTKKTGRPAYGKSLKEFLDAEKMWKR